MTDNVEQLRPNTQHYRGVEILLRNHPITGEWLAYFVMDRSMPFSTQPTSQYVLAVRQAQELIDILKNSS